MKVIWKNLKEEVQGKKVRFSHFRDNELWYQTEGGFLFPVPIADVADTTLDAEDKAIFFMRWIRQYRDAIAADISKSRRAQN